MLGPTMGKLQHPNNDTVDPRIEEIHFLAYGVIAPVIISVGILGNSLTILILRNPKFSGVTYKYFLVLAVSDLVSLVLSVSVFVHIIKEASPFYATAVWYSHLENYLANVPMSTSVLIVVCVTVDRFYSICRPAKFSTFHTESFIHKALLAALVISAIVWLPVCFIKMPKEAGDCESSYFQPPDNRTWWVACMIKDSLLNPWYFAYSWSREIIVIFTPVGILTVLNLMTMREFLRIRKKRKLMMINSVLSRVQGMFSSKEVRYREDKNLIKLLSAVIVSFFLTMVPAGILNAIYTENLSSAYDFEVFRAVANDLEILNHALNFFMYILCSRNIRMTCKKFFHESRISFISATTFYGNKHDSLNIPSMIMYPPMSSKVHSDLENQKHSRHKPRNPCLEMQENVSSKGYHPEIPPLLKTDKKGVNQTETKSSSPYVVDIKETT